MANMIDKEPSYEGEKIVWQAFAKNLPSDWVVYNTRSVNGREYDFCVLGPGVGIFIVEVKGWNADSILTVVDSRTIFLAGNEAPEDSPRGQARGYRFDMLNKLRSELGFNLLVMSLVCYPRITCSQYNNKGLNVVSEENETLFMDDLDDPAVLLKKFIARYNVDKAVKHDELDAKTLALLRHHFEPNYDLKQEKIVLNPGYSRLRVFVNDLDDNDVKTVVDEYFRGIKEIIFVNSTIELTKIVKELEQRFKDRKIKPQKDDLVVGKGAIDVDNAKRHFSVFNFEIEVVDRIDAYVNKNLLVEEGETSEECHEVLHRLSECTEFNYQQYQIEHADSNKNILVTAGAGTGKTYSMVSRVAYLCNRSADAVVNLCDDIAMITFTNDAADNMKKRLKRLFTNYFVLTSNEKYMRLIEEMTQVQISTIHKFAVSLLRKDCLRLGLGYDSQISSETYIRRQLYRAYLNEYLVEQCDKNPDFYHQIPITIYQLEDLLLSFCDKLYDRSVDVCALTIRDFGGAIASMPFFNDLIENVMLKAERDYAKQLKQGNLIGLRECMVQIHNLVVSGKLMKQGLDFKYVFIDEFQDTDDVQIETVAELQKVFGSQCRLFVVGDLKQSIYRFRGASLSAFDRIKAANDIGEWIEYSLNRNYRTDQRLLEKFHQVFSEMGREGVLPYVEKKDRLSSRKIKEYSDDELLRKITVHSKSEDGGYEELFKEIKRQMVMLKKLSETRNLSVEERTIALLVRYNRHINSIINESEKYGIHIKTMGGGDLYRLPSSLDLYRLVMAITHPYNKVYLANLIRSRYVQLNVDLAGISGYDDTKKTDELVYLLDEFFMLHMGKDWDKIVRDFETRPVLVALRDIYEITKPWVHILDEDEQKKYRENFECLVEKITQEYSREYLTIGKIQEFLEINITTRQEEESRSHTSETNEIQVICTTIHKSKGLEYGTVIVPYTSDDITNIYRGGLNVNLVDGKISYCISVDNRNSDFSEGFDEALEIREHMSEESRILYVAMTRAIRNFVWVYDLDSRVDTCWRRYLEVSDLWQ